MVSYFYQGSNIVGVSREVVPNTERLFIIDGHVYSITDYDIVYVGEQIAYQINTEWQYEVPH